MRAFAGRVVCVAALSLSSIDAGAQPSGESPAPSPPPSAEPAIDPEPIRADYAAHAGCPDALAFVSQILARTPRARHAEPSEPARTFVVRIEPHAAGSRGTLAVRDVTGAEATREVVAASCAEVVSALALVSALAIDPQASTSPIEALPAAPAASAAVPRAPIAPQPAPGPDNGPQPPPRAEPEEPLPLALAAGIGAEGAWGLGDDPVLLPRIFVQAELRYDALFSPAVRLSFARAEGKASHADYGEARLIWLAGRFEGCPIRVPANGSFALRPCGGVDIARVSAENESIEQFKEQTRISVAPLLGLHALWQPVGVLLVEANGGVTFPLVRYEFYVDDLTTKTQPELYTVPPIGGFVGASIGVLGDLR